VGHFNPRQAGREVALDDSLFSPVSWDNWDEMIWDPEIKKFFKDLFWPPAVAEISDAKAGGVSSDKVVIVGTAGVALEETEYLIHVRISGDKIKSQADLENLPEEFDPAVMLWNIPDGLKVEMDYNYDPLLNPKEDDCDFDLRVSGVPEWGLKVPIDIFIPGYLLERGDDIEVTKPDEMTIEWNIEYAIEDSGGIIRTATSSVIGSITGKGADLHDITGD
jgi:hypothetical protein